MYLVCYPPRHLRLCAIYATPAPGIDLAQPCGKASAVGILAHRLRKSPERRLGAKKGPADSRLLHPLRLRGPSFPFSPEVTG